MGRFVMHYADQSRPFGKRDTSASTKFVAHLICTSLVLSLVIGLSWAASSGQLLTILRTLHVS